jgi:hypothetical protein
MTSYLDPSGYHDDPGSASNREKSFAITVLLLVVACILAAVTQASWKYYKGSIERHKQERILPGMKTQQVFAILGSPLRTEKAPLSKAYLPNQTEDLSPSRGIPTSRIDSCAVFSSAPLNDLLVYFDSEQNVLGSGRATYFNLSIAEMWY